MGSVTTKTVMNGFRKSNISSESQKAAIAKEDDTFKELDEETDNLCSIQPGLVSENTDAASFTDVDPEVSNCTATPSDADIVAEMLETKDVNNDNDDEIEIEVEPLYYTERNEILQIIEIMSKFFFLSKDGAIVQSYANHATCIIYHHFAEKSRHTTIRDYLQSL